MTTMLITMEQSMITIDEIHCLHCGVDIRWIDGTWLDRETHTTCLRKSTRLHEPLLSKEEWETTDEVMQ